MKPKTTPIKQRRDQEDRSWNPCDASGLVDHHQVTRSVSWPNYLMGNNSVEFVNTAMANRFVEYERVSRLMAFAFCSYLRSSSSARREARSPKLAARTAVAPYPPPPQSGSFARVGVASDDRASQSPFLFHRVCVLLHHHDSF